MKHPLIILIAASIASVSFIAWRVHAMKDDPASAFEEIYDPSLSFTGGCGAVVGSADEVFRDPGVSAVSTLAVLALGDASTAYEPRRLTTYSIPASRKVIEGKQAGIERRRRLLRDLWEKCRSVHPTLVTPIYLGVQQALADLRAKGCKAGSRCGLWVATDLEENADRALEARLRGFRAAEAPLPRRLDNRGVWVAFCGFAQTAGRIVGPSGREIKTAVARGPRLDSRLQAVWRSLFVRPELVRFEPYCPQPSVPGPREAQDLRALREGRQ
ncbi:MAG: hypothetical protein EPN47_13830 [Acidobacteria bacterium]|nr:MAG: hypothetical protein EPN47_13830 [Acidobacteriota bacterium]